MFLQPEFSSLHKHEKEHNNNIGFELELQN